MSKAKHTSSMDRLLKCAYNQRLRDYGLCHLAEVARGFTDMQDDLHELRTHPDRNKGGLKRIELLRKLSDEQLAYMGTILGDLKAG